ncbi:hypothetical protein C5167_002448 [Papaver somniferum]|uniref:Uncharacterized protein n=1 Tax=Papaver somniferum TaxID=3469 RepID=A0A4Y7KZR2_PAPSO|nr:hypothetical protein C5167_002448 [Papaver somniferum]
MQLIRSVLALIPVYFMATSMIPVQSKDKGGFDIQSLEQLNKEANEAAA